MGDIPVPRLAAAILLAASLAALASALVFQYVVGVRPCELCLWQRWPYVAASVFTALGLASGRPAVTRAALGLAALAFLAGAGIAVFHVGVEQHWWAGTDSCSVPGGAASLAELRAQIMAAPIVRCDVVAWSLFGISLAGFNIPISLTLFAVALGAARAPWTRER